MTPRIRWADNIKKHRGSRWMNIAGIDEQGRVKKDQENLCLKTERMLNRQKYVDIK